MKTTFAYLFVVTILSILTAVFATMPSTFTEFLLGFAVCFVFWCGMLTPMLIKE
jgi:uncharacterized membrane protein